MKPITRRLALQRIRLKILVFSFLFLIYFSSSGGHLGSTDELYGYLLTESLVQHQSVYLDEKSPILTRYPGVTVGEFRNIEAIENHEPVTSKYGPLHSIAAIPIFFISNYFSFETDVLISLFFNTVVTATIGVILFSFITRLFHSTKTAFVLTLVNGLTSLLWVHSKFFLDQSLAALTILASAYFLYRTQNMSTRKTFVFAGIFVSLSIFARLADVVIVIGLVSYGVILCRKDIKNLISFLIPVFLGIVTYGLWNLSLGRSFLSPTYGTINYLTLSAHESIEGLYGLFISPGAGLFVYYPLAVLIPLGFYWFYKIDKKLTILIAYSFFSTLIFYGTLTIDAPYGWWGAVWGPRFLIPVLPLISLLIGSVFINLQKNIFKKSLFIALAVSGFVVNLFGTLVYFLHGFTYAWERDELWKIAPNAPVITWDPIHSPIANHIKVLLSDYAQTAYNLDPNPTMHAWGLSPCAFDVYVYCEFGISPLVIIGLSIAVIGILIIRMIRRNETELRN